VWTAREQLLLALCDALHERASIAGQYHMVSFVTNALALAPEPGAARFPTPASR